MRMKKEEAQLKKIILVEITTIVLLVILKYIPMFIFGPDILFDASAHIAVLIFFSYLGWLFIDQNKSWRIPYFILVAAILIIVAIQRIFSQNHNEIGILLGIGIGLTSIIIGEHKKILEKLRF